MKIPEEFEQPLVTGAISGLAVLIALGHTPSWNCLYMAVTTGLMGFLLRYGVGWGEEKIRNLIIKERITQIIKKRYNHDMS